jgi:hypothetical protein
MAGLVHKKIQNLIAESGKSDPMTISYIRTKLVMKGIDPDKWGPTSEDNFEVIAVVEKFSQALIGVQRK